MNWSFRTIFVFCLTAALVSQLPTGSAQTVDPVLLKRFLEEAPKAWNEQQRFRERFPKRNYSWYYHITSRGFGHYGGKSQLTDNTSESKYIGDKYSLHYVSDREKKIEKVFGKNPSYTFQLGRPLGTREWVLQRFEPRKSPGSNGEEDTYGKEIGDYDSAILKFREEDMHGPLFESDYGVFFNKKKKWVDLAPNEIVAIEEKSIDGKSSFVVWVLLRTDGVEPAETPGTFKRVDRWVKAEVVFLPELHWNVTRKESTLYRDKELRDIMAVQKWVAHFEPGFTGYAHHVRVNSERLDGNGKQTDMLESSFASEVRSYSSNEFKLSAFGLPEPESYKPPRPWWLYMSILGIILIMAGGILFRYGKKQWRS